MNLTLTRGADERGRPRFDVYRGATFRLDERGAATLLDDDYAPVDAIELTLDYDIVGHTRQQMIFDKAKLLHVYDVTIDRKPM